MFTWIKILLNAENYLINSPLDLNSREQIGKIYLLYKVQSAVIFRLFCKTSVAIKNTYNKYTSPGGTTRSGRTPSGPKLLKISEHPPLHKSDLTDDEFGYFLAGLIEGDGWFGKKELHVIFAEEDVSLAYFIKKRIGHGHVSPAPASPGGAAGFARRAKIKNKKAYRYICKNNKGLLVILSLINGKFVSNLKYQQLINHDYEGVFNLHILPPTKKVSLNNYWLAGFSQADGCFYISVVKSSTHKTGYSVRLEYSLKQNDQLPLKLLYDLLNKGNLSQYSSGIWCYKSSGYSTAYDLINYFDKFTLFGGKYISYLKFRKVYIMITEGKHLDKNGIQKIISIKN